MLSRGVCFLLACYVCWHGALCLPGGIVGGWSPADPTSATVQQMADFSVREYNSQSGENTMYRMTVLLHAQQQVVAGMNYRLDMILGSTVCSRNDNRPINQCPVQSKPHVKKIQCEFVVYYVAWVPSTSLTSKKCQPL